MKQASEILTLILEVFPSRSAPGMLTAFGNHACYCLFYMLSVKTIKGSQAVHPVFYESVQN